MAEHSGSDSRVEMYCETLMLKIREFYTAYMICPENVKAEYRPDHVAQAMIASIRQRVAEQNHTEEFTTYETWWDMYKDTVMRESKSPVVRWLYRRLKRPKMHVEHISTYYPQVAPSLGEHYGPYIRKGVFERD